MNPNNQPRKSPGPVMDVQRPRQSSAPINPVTPLDNSMAPADNIVSATTNVGQNPAQTPGQPPQEIAKPRPGPKKKMPIGIKVAIITGVVILLVSIGAGGFIWYTSNNQPAPVATEPQSESERVNVEQIDGTIADIDKTLNTLDDSSDVTPGDVSDSSLGL